jgi:hypothetical protein
MLKLNLNPETERGLFWPPAGTSTCHGQFVAIPVESLFHVPSTTTATPIAFYIRRKAAAYA